MTNYEFFEKQIKDIFINRIGATPCKYCPDFLWEKCPKSTDMPCGEWVKIWLNEEAKEE